MSILDEYAKLWHEFEIEKYGVFDKEKCEEYNKLKAKITSALKLQKLVIDMKEQVDGVLADIQNWLSKDGKFSTEITTNKVLRDLMKKSHTTTDETKSDAL